MLTIVARKQRWHQFLYIKRFLSASVYLLFLAKTARTDVKLTCTPEVSPSRSTDHFCPCEKVPQGSLQGLEKHLGNHNFRNLGLLVVEARCAPIDFLLAFLPLNQFG